MLVCWVGAGAGLLAGGASGWAVTSWWRDRPHIKYYRTEDGRWTAADSGGWIPGSWRFKWQAGRAVRRIEKEWGELDGDGDLPPPEELPPERSREELGFTGERPAIPFTRAHIDPRVPLSAALERRAPWWEAEHRAAYESLGFDYPSGLMTRVRELTP